VAILAGGKWFYAQLQLARVTQNQLVVLQNNRPEFGNTLLNAAKQLEQQMEQFTIGGFNGKLSQALEDMLSKKVAEQDAIKSRSPFEGLPNVADFQRLAVLEMEISALKRALENARQFEWLASDIRGGREQWKRLSDDHIRLRKSFDDDELAKSQLRIDFPIASENPFSEVSDKIDSLIEKQKETKRRADELRLRIENLKLSVELQERRLKVASTDLLLGKVNVDAALRRSDELIKREIQRQSGTFFGAAAKDFWVAVDAEVPTAISILLGAILVPIGIKLMFFYVIAPLASRRPPIQVSQNPDAGVPVKVTQGSEVSISLSIKPDEELLVDSEYLQNSPVGTSKTNKWFLNNSYPFTSIAAGLYFLTRIAPTTLETVGVSSGKNSEMKVSVIEVPEGSSIVLQPRGLVGVLQQRSRPLRISSKWLSGYLHSWLTLQFRYLVFHGPVKLVMKGCRGVRMEPTGGGRLINQSATLGFSANAKYSVRRCETFVSYWRGVEELFNDQFAGTNSVYIYEEMPSLHRKAGIAGRGLEGLTDSVLKVFGI